MIFACTDHIDCALEDYIDGRQNAPKMTFVREWKTADGNVLNTRCGYCERDADYALTQET